MGAPDNFTANIERYGREREREKHQEQGEKPKNMMGDRKATEDKGWEINERGGGKAGDDRGQNGRTVSPDLHPDLTKR